MPAQLNIYYPRPAHAYARVLFHGSVWVLYIVFVAYINRYQGVDFVVGHPSIHILAEATIFYLNYGFFIPNLLAKGRTIAFTLLNLGSMAVLVMLFVPIYHALRNWYLGAAAVPFPLNLTEQFTLRFFELLLFAAISCIIRFTTDWFTFQQRARELENAQLRTELAFLRSQLNPHFLFNTLNALYALAMRQARETSDGIMQLSQLMRYVLYETNEGKVLLSREVEMIENFLELQRLRLPLDFPLDFEVVGMLDQQTIEPLLLLPIVENIFKHGSGFARIQLTLHSNEILLESQNGVGNPNQEAPQIHGGIGLSNLKRRLLHLYPGRHRLAYGIRHDHFYASLSLNF